MALNQRAAIYSGGSVQILGDEPFVNGATGGVTPGNGVNWATVFNNEIYICGSIQTIGGRSINNVARWDGAHWQPVGAGLNLINGQSTTANNIFTAGGSLYLFTKTNSGSVYHFARWTGTTWALDPFTAANSYIRETVQGPDGLYFVGDFTNIGGVAATRLARFDGAAFSAVGPAAPVFTTIPSICFYGGVLHAYGTITGGGAKQLYKLVGGSWVLVPGAPDTFTGLTEFNGGLYGADNGDAFGSAHRWWRWDGSTWTITYVFDTTGTTAPFGNPQQTVVSDGVMYFSSSTVPSTESPTAGSWDGVTWRAMGGGSMNGTNSPVIKTFQEFRGELYCGGFKFAITQDGRRAGPVARWTPAGWELVSTPFTAPEYVTGLGVWKGQLLAGHVNTNSSQPFFTAVVDGLSRWDGTNWRPMTTGYFSRSGGALDFGPFLTHNGNLCTLLPSLATWDGSSWSPVRPAATPSCMIEVDGRLYIGGSFTGLDFDRVIANRVAVHDGVTWRSVGYGMNSDVYGFATYQGQLVALGRFTQADANPATGIARWNGSRWEGIPTTGLSTLSGGDFQFRSAIEYAGELYAIGPGRLNGVAPTASVFRWNGQQWNVLGGDAPGFAPSTLAVHDGELFLAGVMTGNTGYPMGWGRWSRAGNAVISRPPADTTVPLGGAAAFSAASSGGVTYQWQREIAGVFGNLSEGVQASGAFAAGTQTPSLSLTGVQASDAGRYRLTVSTSCASVTSFPATLIVNP